MARRKRMSYPEFLASLQLVNELKERVKARTMIFDGWEKARYAELADLSPTAFDELVFDKWIELKRVQDDVFEAISLSGWRGRYCDSPLYARLMRQKILAWHKLNCTEALA